MSKSCVILDGFPARNAMKYAIIIPDGCADEPQESLGGQTPMQAANIPAMDEVAAAGVVGRASNVPAHLPPGSDVANLSLLGYDPNLYFTGRAPLEAAAQGIQLGVDDWAIRCNLVTIEDQVMRSFTAGHVSTEEATELLKLAQEDLGEGPLEFVPGVSYRNLLLFRSKDEQAPFSNDTRTTPPHDLTDKSVADDFPRGPGSDLLTNLMSRTVELFADHAVNAARLAAGKPAATNIWLWGLGKTPQLVPFQQLHGKTGKMITAVDLLRGLATLIGWDRIEVPGATGYTDTDYAAKGRYAVEAIPTTDIICVHVEATDEASHEGDIAAKIKALEEIDRHVVRPVVDALKAQGDYRILVSPDHPTPVRTKTHSHGAVPLCIAGSGIASDTYDKYDEPTAYASDLVFDEGSQLMPYFLKS
jgi:2,3-bisphosphoglycerate-independent phosphoglycerate mutase